MSAYRLISEPEADLDVEAAFEWYENEQSALGFEFLDELRAAYDLITDGPLKYQHLRSGIRRALLTSAFHTRSTLRSRTLSLLWSPFFTPVAIRRNGSAGGANSAAAGDGGETSHDARCA